MMVTDANCEYLGLSRLCLMEAAGKSLGQEVAKIAVFSYAKPVKVVMFTGSGGNGGDAFVAARYLLNRGYDVEIYMLKDKALNKNKIKNSKKHINLFTKIVMFELIIFTIFSLLIAIDGKQTKTKSTRCSVFDKNASYILN